MKLEEKFPKIYTKGDPDWNPPAWLAPNGEYITPGYNYTSVATGGNPREDGWTALYPKQQWVGITDNEITECWINKHDHGAGAMYAFACAIEAKLREKNS